MNKKRTLRQVAVALLLLVAFLFQGTWALAGTTGGVSGQVTDENGAAVAGASVKVVSASQAASATTDASGRFNFLSLAPDTYTVSIEKDGFSPVSYAGVTVFADNQLALSFKMQKALKTIAKVTARAAGDLVKAGVGSDVYNVNSAAITNSAALGGGGNLNSAFSAIASVPGVVVPSGGTGWGQATYVRGSQSFFTGFEYDGIPVNRAFDNYNSSTESNLGLQELQVYTGGGPASNSSSGTSGFINQVFKTGTYPGYGTLSGGIGAPTFYHQAKVEVGGATPDRRFSYYFGLSGYNQAFRFLDNSNGGSIGNDPTGVYTNQISIFRPTLLGPGNECSTTTGADPSSPTAGSLAGAAMCYLPVNAAYARTALITDRETVANFHFRVPRKNGTSDDLQLLGSSSALVTVAGNSVNDFGGPNLFSLAEFATQGCNPATSTLYVGGAACAPAPNGNFLAYRDQYVYNLPFGSPVAGLAPGQYFQPSSPANRAFNAPIPLTNRDTVNNDTGILKLQYTHQLSSSAFVRVFGYTFFSDWTQAGANDATTYHGFLGAAASPNYDLITHTSGGELQFVDQINPAHLLELTGNYTSANVVRFNNYFYRSSQLIGLINTTGGTTNCYSKTTGAQVVCGVTGPYTVTAGSLANGGALPPVPAAAPAGTYWGTLWNGNQTGPKNSVKPQFGFVSLSDQWRPSDKLLINAAIRYDSFQYGLNTPGTADAFWANAIATSYCWDSNHNLLASPLTPGTAPPPPAIATLVCPAGYTHVPFTAASPNKYNIADVSPRLSATYTQSPDTVWRGSIGRFTEPPISASVQYLSASGDNRSVWSATIPFGFVTPFHPIPAQSATQADLSLERHIRGTDMSFKITPFYNFTVGAQQQSFIGSGFVTQIPVGNFRSTGVELAFTKGDFAKDGFSGQVALTYTSAKQQFTNYFGTNQMTQTNAAIQAFNQLTSQGDIYGTGATGIKGSPYYCGGVGVSSPTAPGCTAATVINNPYYNLAPQPTQTINGWYPAADFGMNVNFAGGSVGAAGGGFGYYDSPWNMSLILNYRKNKFAITPSVQLTQGSSYGSPLDVVGIDPRACGANQTALVATDPGITGTTVQNCDYGTTGGGLASASSAAGYLYIPNPENGNTFATPGQFRNPWLLVGNLAMTYDISPKVSANLTIGNLFHTCFGGTKAAWTSAYAPGANYCAYGPNWFAYSGVGTGAYNGSGPTDALANGVANVPAWQLHSYFPAPANDSGGISSPLNFFFSVNVKL